MLEQAQEHAESLAAESSLERDRLNAQQQNIARQQNNVSAANALREAALKQQGLLGTQRIQNESDSISARSALDQAKTDALNKKNNTDSNLKTMSIQAAAQMKSQNPSISDAELISRFPMLSPKDIPPSPRVATGGVGKVSPLFPPGVQDQLFKQLLVNSQGGTNTDEAVSGLKRYMTPPPTGTATAPDSNVTSAADALTQPTAQSVDQLPNPDEAPITATNPKTGEKLIFQQGQWQPIPPPQ